MRRETLLDFFEDFSTLDDTFLVHDDGYRVRQATYRQVAAAARGFAQHLHDTGAAAADGEQAKVVIWSENRAEWVVALWGCLLARVVLVPVDYRASADLLVQITSSVKAKAVRVGDEVEVPSGLSAPVWKRADTIALDELRNSGPPESRNVRNLATSEPITGSTLAEIIFTSGATA